VGHRPSGKAKPPRRKKRRNRRGVSTLAQLYADGRDFWSGRPLVGRDAQNWLQIQFEEAETRMSEEQADEYLNSLCDTILNKSLEESLADMNRDIRPPEEVSA
jgi:hypothetical protein